MGLVQPARSTTGKPLTRFHVPQPESALLKLSRALQPVLPMRMRMTGRTMPWRIQGLRNRRSDYRVASTHTLGVLPTIRRFWSPLSGYQTPSLSRHPLSYDPMSCAPKKYRATIAFLVSLRTHAPTILCPVEYTPAFATPPFPLTCIPIVVCSILFL